MLKKLWALLVGEETHAVQSIKGELIGVGSDADEIAKRTAAYVVAELRKAAADGKAAIAKVPRVRRSPKRATPKKK